MKVLVVLYNDSLQGVTTFNYTLLEAIKTLAGDHTLEFHVQEIKADGHQDKFLDLGIAKRTDGNNYDVVFINNRPGLKWVIESGITSGRYVYLTHSLPNDESLQKIVLPPAAPAVVRMLDSKLEVAVFSETAKNYLDGLGHSTTLIRNAINLTRFSADAQPSSIEKILIFDLRNNMLYRQKVQNLSGVMPKTYVRALSAPIWSIESEIAAADLVIAYGRCAIEAMAIGKPVIVYGENGGDGLVTDTNKAKLAETNFSGWSLRNMPIPEFLSEIDILAHIQNYNAEDTALVQTHIRTEYSTTKLLVDLDLNSS